MKNKNNEFVTRHILEDKNGNYVTERGKKVRLYHVNGEVQEGIVNLIFDRGLFLDNEVDFYLFEKILRKENDALWIENIN